MIKLYFIFPQSVNINVLYCFAHMYMDEKNLFSFLFNRIIKEGEGEHGET